MVTANATTIVRFTTTTKKHKVVSTLVNRRLLTDASSIWQQFYLLYVLHRTVCTNMVVECTSRLEPSLNLEEIYRYTVSISLKFQFAHNGYRMTPIFRQTRCTQCKEESIFSSVPLRWLNNGDATEPQGHRVNYDSFPGKSLVWRNSTTTLSWYHCKSFWNNERYAMGDGTMTLQARF